MAPTPEQHEGEMAGDFVISDSAVQRIMRASEAMTEARTSDGRRPHQRRFRERLGVVMHDGTPHPDPWRHEEPQARHADGDWQSLELRS